MIVGLGEIMAVYCWGIYKLCTLKSIAVGRVTIESSVHAVAATLFNAYTCFAERALCL